MKKFLSFSLVFGLLFIGCFGDSGEGDIRYRVSKVTVCHDHDLNGEITDSEISGYYQYLYDNLKVKTSYYNDFNNDRIVTVDELDYYTEKEYKDNEYLNLLSSIQYGEVNIDNMEMNHRKVYTYDGSRNVQLDFYDNNNMLNNSRFYEYDENGNNDFNIIKYFDQSGDVIDTSFIVIEYDENNNWIKKQAYFDTDGNGELNIEIDEKSEYYFTGEYNSKNQMIKITRYLSNQIEYSHLYEYNVNSKISKINLIYQGMLHNINFYEYEEY